jgi:hypothetical protein
MAKAAKKRSKKKTAKRKGAAKRRKTSRKGKSAPKKSVRKSTKRKAAKKAPPKNPETAWPVLFATIAAICAGLFAAWVLSDFSIAASAATLSTAPIADTPWAAVHDCAAKVVQTADTWLALAHPNLVPTLR